MQLATNSIRYIGNLMIFLWFFSWASPLFAQNNDLDIGESAFQNLPWTKNIQHHFAPTILWLSHLNSTGSGKNMEFPGHTILLSPLGGSLHQIANAISLDAKAQFFYLDATIHSWNSRKLDTIIQNPQGGNVIYIHQIHLWLRYMSEEEQNNFKNWLALLPRQQTTLVSYSNRPDLIPRYLFDAFALQLGIDRPDMEIRKTIFEHELKKINIGLDVSGDSLATMTPGYHVGEIQRVCRKATDEAALHNREQVQLEDFEKAIVVMNEEFKKEMKWMKNN